MNVAGTIVGVASLVNQGTHLSFEIILEHRQNSRWVSLYGYWRILFLQLAFPDVLDIIERIHKDVIRDGALHAATLTRDAMCAKYNMTAVAVSISFLISAVNVANLNRAGGNHCTGGRLRPWP